MSDLRFVMRYLGVCAPRHVSEDSDWMALRQKLTKIDQISVAGILNYLNEQQIDINTVTSAVFDDFHDWAVSRVLCKNPKKLVNRARKAWMRLAETVPGWPPVAVIAKDKAAHFAVGFEMYPEPFRQDVDRWELLAKADPAEQLFMPRQGSAPSPNSRRRAARPATVKIRLYQIKLAAGALVRSGVAPEKITSLGCLVSPREHPVQILRYIQWHLGKGRSETARGVAEMLRQIGKFWAHLSVTEVDEMARWVKALAPEDAGSMTAKNELRLRKLVEPDCRSRLLALPRILMRDARSGHHTVAMAATIACRALVLELLTNFPLRISNIQNLRLDRHLQRLDPRSRIITHLAIDGDEVKNGVRFLWPLPTSASKMIETYIMEFRPTISTSDNLYLFPGKTSDRPMHLSTLQSGLAKVTSEHVGVHVNPHLLRHFAGYTYLSAYPGDYEGVRRILGHKDIQTTMKIYCGLETNAAARRLDEIVDFERRSSRGRLAETSSYRSVGRTKRPKRASFNVRSGDEK
jgi:integrase